MTEQSEPKATPVIAPELAQAALVLLDRAPIQGRGEAKALLQISAILEAIARQ